MLNSKEFLALLTDETINPTREELEQWIDEEMEKSEEEMDTELIECCLHALNAMDARERKMAKERGESNDHVSCGEKNITTGDEDKTENQNITRRKLMKKKILVTAATIALIICTAIASVTGLNLARTNKIEKIENTIYPITIDLDTAEKNYNELCWAYDIFDKAKHVGFMNNVFVGKVEKIMGTTYTDVSIDTFGKVSATPWTNYEVTVLGNIKGNLKTGITIPIRKWAGLEYGKTSISLFGGDTMPKQGRIYIFCAFADEEGELYIGCAESNIILRENCEDDVKRALAGEVAITYEENPVIYTINEYQEAEKKHDNSVAGDRERNSVKAEYLEDKEVG